jgi:hypothetical protein
MAKSLLELSREGSTPIVSESDQPKPKEQGLSKLENRGKAIREKEFTIFARIMNFSQLKNANRGEIQEQYIIPVEQTEENAGKGSIRVRKITARNGRSRYELTTKNKMGEGDSIEVTVPTTKENFIQFKVLSTVAMLKHRYTFNIKGTDKKWEVDAVPDGNGSYCPWVRCEIEVDDLESKDIPELPLEVEELILPPELGKLTQEEYDKKTKPIMDRFFTSSNPYIDDENSATTELEGEVDTDDENQEENPEEKGDETTGKEVMSVDNITDEKETADKVEARSEQIVDKREENEEAEKAEEEKEEGGEDGDTTEEGDSEKSEDGNKSEGEEDKGEDTGETEEVSKESYEYLKGLGVDLSKVKVSTESSDGKGLIEKFSELFSKGFFKSSDDHNEYLFSEPSKSLKGGEGLSFSKIGTSNGGAVLKVKVKEMPSSRYKILMVPYSKGKDPLDVALDQLNTLSKPEAISKLIDTYKSNLEFYKLWAKNFKKIVEGYQDKDDPKDPEDLVDYISYYSTDKRIFEYYVPEFKNHEYKEINLYEALNRQIPFISTIDNFEDKIILSNEKSFNEKVRVIESKAKNVLGKYKELLKIANGLESPLDSKNPANEYVGHGDGDEYHDDDLMFFKVYVECRLQEIIDILELTYVKELYSLYGLNSDSSVSQEGFGSPECIHQDNPVTPPVEVTQGEDTEEEPETKENPYEPSLDAIVKMSKFQEGERDFNVKSADEWK